MARTGPWRREYPAPLFALQSELNRLFDEFLRPASAADPSPAPTPTVGLAEGAWAPPVDLYDAGGEFVLVADVPGVDPATIDLSVTGDVLTVRGERAASAEGVANGQAVVRECPAGPFLRQVRLAAEVDVDAIRAEARHGVLTIRLPKQTAAQPRTIRVQPA